MNSRVFTSVPKTSWLESGGDKAIDGHALPADCHAFIFRVSDVALNAPVTLLKRHACTMPSSSSNGKSVDSMMDS